MAIDELSLCLNACNGLYYETHKLTCNLFESFRKAAWPILRDPKCEWTPQAEDIRRKLWRLVRDLCQTPKSWTGTLSENLGYDRDFVRLVELNLGEEQKATASNLVWIWDSMCSASGNSGPIAALLSEQIRTLRNDFWDFRILATKPEQVFYQSLLNELELSGNHLFCTPNKLKQQKPFACLVTCGPFRDNDFVFTAPRYDTILNVRWASDDDVIGFPDYLTIRDRSEDEARFPDDFPVRITEAVFERKFTYNLETTPVEMAGDWSYHEFEQIYIPRSRRRTRFSKQRGVDHGSDSSEVLAGSCSTGKPIARYSNLVFYNGATLVQPFDQLNKPRLMLSIDPETDSDIKKRRPRDPLKEPEGDDDWLEPGMFVIVQPNASDDLAAAATTDRQIDVVHLPRWKAKLREKLAALREAGRSVKFAMQQVGLDEEYRDISVSLRWWSKYELNKTHAPGKVDAFKKLVCDFVGYADWTAAWEELNNIWNESISVGLTRESNIDKYLIASVRQHIDKILDSPQTFLDVEGFSSKVLVIEVAEIQFLTDKQVDRADLDRIVGLEVEQLRD